MPETAGAAIEVPDRKRYQGPTGRFRSSKTAYWTELVSYSSSNFHCADRAERIWLPGATRSGLKRPKSPSNPMPTLPRLEKLATSVSESVAGSRTRLVRRVAFVSGTRNWRPPAKITRPCSSRTTALVSRRSLSRAPTVRTFLALPGAETVPRKPPTPLSPPPPELPAANTNRTGCSPDCSGSASREAMS